MKIAIVDDNPTDIEKVKCMLIDSVSDKKKIEIFEYLGADEFLREMQEKQFDVVFLDIVLKERDGIAIGKEINCKSPYTNIVFVSAHPGYFKDVYKVSHVYFLTKELEEIRFKDAVIKVLNSVRERQIYLHLRNEYISINSNDIMYIESKLKNVILHMKSGELLEYRASMKKIEAILPDDTFVRTHQSFIVNMHFITKYSRQIIFMSDERQIPVSRAYINSAREKLAFYLGGTI